MLKKFKILIKRNWDRCVWFLHFARAHRIKLNPKDWFKGVICLLIGWGLLGLSNVLFNEPIEGVGYKINLTVQFSSGLFFILVGLYVYGLVRRIPRQVTSFLKVSHQNEVSGSAILKLQTRKTLIRIRGVIAVGGYIGFELARSAIGIVDNAVMYGADALMYVLLAVTLLKHRYNNYEKTGIFTIIIGVCILVYFDLISINHINALKGSAFGLGSSLSLAIILILTSVIIQHDHPVRVTFYQCFYGLLIAVSLLAFSIPELMNTTFSLNQLGVSALEGLLYVVAVVFLLQAFYYVDPIIVAISSYSLDLYSIVFNLIVYKEIINLPTFSSVVLIASGSGVLIRAEYKKYKKQKSKRKP